MLVQGQRGRWVWLQKATMGIWTVFEIVQYLDSDDEHINLHVIKLYRTKYTHTHNEHKTGEIGVRLVDFISVNILIMILTFTKCYRWRETGQSIRGISLYSVLQLCENIQLSQNFMYKNNRKVLSIQKRDNKNF